MKKKYRLKKWAQTLYAVLGAFSFCILTGLSAMEFTFTSIVIVGVVLGIFGFSAHMLSTYGRDE